MVVNSLNVQTPLHPYKIFCSYYLLKLYHPHSMLVHITVWWYRRLEVNRKTNTFWATINVIFLNLIPPCRLRILRTKRIGFLSAYQQDCGVTPLHYRCRSQGHFRFDIYFQNGRIRRDLIANKFSYFVNTLCFITCHKTRK